MNIGFVGRLSFQKDPLRAVKIFSLAYKNNKKLRIPCQNQEKNHSIQFYEDKY